MPAFLLEIGAEEMPDGTIEPALADLRSRFERLLAEEAIGGAVAWTDGSPRRLALVAEQLVARQADRDESVMGPPKTAGAGAARAFAAKMGTTPEALGTEETAKGAYFTYRKTIEGRATSAVLAAELPRLIRSLPFPKIMYWPAKGGGTFTRPIRWIVAVLDDEIVPFEYGGVQSDNWTRGHRVLGSGGPLAVTPANYESRLRDDFVLIRAAERERLIRAGLSDGVQVDVPLLHTLTYLTEWPSTVRGQFDAAFLDLPKEILVTVMRHHQRYFSVTRPDGSLAPEFVAVTNTSGDPDGLIRRGNERVLRARFNDARFFWRVDQQKPLAARLADLTLLTFQAKIGNYREKTERMMALAADIAQQLGARVAAARRAAELAKTDLTTEMVKEFPELQGIVGGLYARAQGEPEEVAKAIYDQYRPLTMSDELPLTREGQVVSLADKIDTLRECFRAGLIPTGSKDPFALRRAAQGVIRLLFEASLPLPLFDYAATDELKQFLGERIAFYLRDVRGYPYDEVNAVLAAPVTTLDDLQSRLEAVHRVRPTANFEPLAASFKRIKNILKQAGVAQASAPEASLLTPGPEHTLYQRSAQVREELAGTSSYQAKLEAIASLRPHVDLFFDKILVNDSDPKVRQNRLALLSGLMCDFSQIADFSEIVVSGSAGPPN